MQRQLLIGAILVLSFTVAGHAGTISGKVSGVSGTSVVYVDAVPGKTMPPPARHAIMDQRGLLFQPHVMVVQKGATVEFLNSDTVAHNVFWPSISGNRKLGHNLGTFPKGEKRPFKFDNPGVVPLLCIVHPDMSAYLIVVPAPYYAETDNAGDYKIENVPDGSYKVTAWHEGAKEKTKPVNVSGVAKVDFTLSK